MEWRLVFQLVRGLAIFQCERHLVALRGVEIKSFLTELNSSFAFRGVHEYYSYEAVCPPLW